MSSACGEGQYLTYHNECHPRKPVFYPEGLSVRRIPQDIDEANSVWIVRTTVEGTP